MSKAPFHDLTAFDPLEAETLQCPYAWHEALRSDAPVHFVESRGMWFVTSRELIAEALVNHGTFSSSFGMPQLPAPESVATQVAEIEAQGWPAVATLLSADPPEHHFYRRMVARAFTPKFVARTEPAIRKIAARTAQRIPTGTPVEFIGSFAAPLPLLVIADVLNVSADRIDDFKRWSDLFTASVGAELDDAGRLDQARGMLEFQKYFAAELDSRRANPRDDLLSGLVAAPSVDSDEVPLSTEACLSIVQQLLIAGNETSTKMLTSALHQLALAPRWWEWLRENPRERSAAIIEETLRFASPVQAMFRITTAETCLGGTVIPAGALVVLAFGSANRDEAIFDQASRFNPERADAKNHLAFGTGIHACLGAPLARLQGRIAIEVLADRFAAVGLAEHNDFRYEESFMLRGLRHLWLNFETL